MTITCGIDWAESHHDVALADAHGTVVARQRISVGAEGFSLLLGIIAEHGGSPQDTPVAIETDKNLVVVALAGAGFTVYPINPRAVARYRERHGQAGGKSDPGDAAVLANILRTDQPMHRSLPAISEHALAIKALARQHAAHRPVLPPTRRRHETRDGSVWPSKLKFQLVKPAMDTRSRTSVV